MPIVETAAPPKSSFAGTRSVSRRNSAAPTMIRMPIGTLTNITHSQPKLVVRKPPRIRPIAPPLPAASTNRDIARARFAPSVVLATSSTSVLGAAIAAPTPCSTRAATRTSGVGREAAHRRGDDEDGDADDQREAGTDDRADLAAEQDEAAEGQGVGGDHPREVGGGEVQLFLDVGERDVHDARVDHEHELRDEDDDEAEGRAAQGAADGG